MKFTIIGLGNYGKSLAVQLTSLGHEVIGADIKANTVDAIKDKIATAYKMDVTDPISLSALPLLSTDMVIVTIGENLGASVKVVALLKQLGVKTIFARAIDDIHKAILEAFDISRILTPELDSATEFIHSIDFGSQIKSFPIDDDYYVVKFTIPNKIVGFSINSLKLEEQFNITIISVTSASTRKNKLGIPIVEHKVSDLLDGEYEMLENDELVCYGTYKSFHKLWKDIM